MTLNQFVDIVSTQAAKLFGIFPQKGTIAVGSDADIVIFDPNAKRSISANTHHMNVDYSAFEDMKIVGEPISVLCRGHFIIKDKQFVGTLGSGKYLKRRKFNQEITPTVSQAKI